MPRKTTCRSKLFASLVLLGAAAVPFSAAVSQAAGRPAATYTVRPGDTLFSIARQLLGDHHQWSRIFELNRDVLGNPNRIEPGQVLRVPLDGERVSPAEPAPAVATPPAPEVSLPTPQRPARGVVTFPSEPTEEQQDTTFRRRRAVDATSALRTYRDQPYRALRSGEFHSAGFLTEDASLPFGVLLGTVTPPQISNLSNRTSATLHTTVAIRAPEGATYRVGDSLLVVQLNPGPAGYGQIVLPTGMIRVTEVTGAQLIGTVVSVYGPIRSEQLLLPVEPFTDGGTSRALPVADGVTGTVLARRELRELAQPQQFLFIDRGSRDGVARGDLFEIRRAPEARVAGGAGTIDELMAVVQVVHVRERSATVRIVNVISPDIPPGTPVKQVGKLPT
ncbi:MAG: LysM peptidoglycan-binding domain-containing protein [Gemmatimonadales bacterium]|nr:LysM peptidoglycan-binding domain-containing protein [Gemmatimonadales bacterium]